MNPKKKNQTALIIVLAALVFWLGLVIQPCFSAIKKLSQDFIFQKQELYLLKETTQNLEKFKIDYRQMETKLKKLEAGLVNFEVPVDFISFLETCADESEVKIKISSVHSTDNLRFQINSASSLPDLLKFLEKLRLSNYSIDLQSINIKKTDKGIEGNFTINALTQ